VLNIGNVSFDTDVGISGNQLPIIERIRDYGVILFLVICPLLCTSLTLSQKVINVLVQSCAVTARDTRFSIVYVRPLVVDLWLF